MKNKATEIKVVVGLGNNHTKHLIDSGTGVEIEFTHRLPTNQERVRYQNEAISIKGKKMIIKNQGAARHLVKLLLLGFRFPNSDPNTWLQIEMGGELVPISCEATAKGYVKDWPQVIEKVVPGMLENLGMQIFAGVSDASSNIEFDYGYGEDGEEETPFELAGAAEPAGEEEAPNPTT